jgi:NAD+ synthase (glutamine-hydrolysing)
LLVTIAANMDPYADDHALFIRCRALENGLPHVYVNCVGERGNFRFCGGSAVIDASGHVLAQLPAYEPALVVAEVPTAERRTPDYLADRRPDVAVRTLAPLREGTEPTEPTGPTEPTEPMLLSAAVSKAPRR